MTANSSVSNASRGKEVVVVYNSRLPESKQVADYYARRREVPENQVIGFDLTTHTDLSRKDFRETLQRPLAKALSDRKLWRMGAVSVASTNGFEPRVEWRPVESSIRYLVLCYGVPFRIAADNDLKENGIETWRPELRRNEAAVDSELALLPAIEQNLMLAGPLRSWLYMATNALHLHPTNGLLLVTRLDGPSDIIARGLVDKAIEAERNGLWGRAYIDLRSITEGNYKPGEITLANAGEMCRRLGFETVFDTNSSTFPASFPMSHIAVYAGWYDETVSGPFSRPEVEFMPGAFAYHLHSFSAASLRSATHNWVGPLLAKGATITLGSVSEPYLGGTPDIAILVGRLLYDGFTFGEAAYASSSVLSWQTTVVGDPLYRPAGRNIDALMLELVAKKSRLAEWGALRLANINLANGRSSLEVTAYIENLELRHSSSVLSEKLGRLYEMLGKPASALQMYQQALQLNPSPNQRLRLRLTLADFLVATDKKSDAAEMLQKLLEENPDYPDRGGIEARLALLRPTGR